MGEPNSQAPSRAPAWPVDTPGDRYDAEFDNSTPTTREGQLIFFAQFLKAGILKVSRFLHDFEAIAEEWSREQLWGVLLTYVLRRWLGGKWLGELPPNAQALLSNAQALLSG